MSTIQIYFELCPCVGLLASYVCGLLGQPFAAGPLLLTFLRRRRWAYWLFFLLGLFNHEGLHWYPGYGQFLRRASCGVQMRCIVQEENAAGYGVKGIFCVREVMSNGQWVKVHGIVQAIYSELQGAGCSLECQGALVEIPDFGGYNQWLRSQGIRHWFYPKCLVPHSSTWYSNYLVRMETWRETLCRRLAAGLHSPECKGMLCAMVFGAKGVLSSEMREIFVRSSSVHIFSVSGLHVGLVFAGFSLLFRLLGLPQWVRHLLVLLLVFGYVLLCGSYASALRAYFMLSLLVLTDLQNRSRSSENSLAFAAIVLLMVQPGYLLNSGFLYSFTLVGVLLRGRGLVKELVDLLTEKQQWLPPASRWPYRLWGSLLSTMASGIIAWLGCCGLMMHFNQFVSFSAFLVNLAMIPAATLVVWGALFKLLWNAQWLATALEVLLKGMLLVSRAGSSGWYQEGPSLNIWLVLLYYLALILFLCKWPWGGRLSCLAVSLAIFIGFCLMRQKNSMIYCGGRDGKKGAVVRIDTYGRGIWLQTGGYSGMRNAMTELRERGIAVYHQVHVPYGSDYFALERLLDQSHVEEVIFEARALNSRKLRSLLPKIRARGIHLSVQDETPAVLLQPMPELYHP